MDKNHRLFLRNLPADIEKDDLENLFKEHGKLSDVDIKEKIQNNGSKIAFVNITTTDLKLNGCFRAVDRAILRGNAIRVEVAKESYLDRLKREREEAATVKAAVKQVIPRDRPIERLNIKIPETKKVKPTKRIYNFDDVDNEESANENEKTSTAADFAYDPALVPEEIPLCKIQSKIENPIPAKTIERVEKIAEKKVLGESEIKRLASVKQKRQAFRANEKLISHALKAVDSAGRNNKIIFFHDTNNDDTTKKKKSLFDDDDEEKLEEHGDWNDNAFQHDEKRNAKLKMSLNNLGRDKRFAIDERFLDDEDNSGAEIIEEENENNLKNETKRQLEILENVLGKPFRARDDKQLEKKRKMIRYDPTSSVHKEHELEISKPVIKAKKIKLSNIVEQEEKPIPVSSQVFYEVSENLTEALKPQEEFSLLKSFGAATTDDKNKIDEYTNFEQGKEWEHNHDAKNPFKYESSDEEAPYPSMDQLKTKNEILSMSNITKGSETFFFATNDGRFHEAEEFFSKRPTIENFTSVRRELKQIVRSKIRNNVKKNTPWRNSKIATRAKIR